MNCDKKEEKICCFFGHRRISKTEELMSILLKTVEELIVNEKVDVFLFGSKSEFDCLCLETVTKLKEKYTDIKRIYVRAEFLHIDEEYRNYLLKYYDDTYFPKCIQKSGRASYVKRNRKMIDKSNFCIVYYDKNYLPPQRKIRKKDLSYYQLNSGTKLAYEYAKKKEKKIINVFLSCL